LLNTIALKIALLFSVFHNYGRYARNTIIILKLYQPHPLRCASGCPDIFDGAAKENTVLGNYHKLIIVAD